MLHSLNPREIITALVKLDVEERRKFHVLALYVFMLFEFYNSQCAQVLCNFKIF